MTLTTSNVREFLSSKITSGARVISGRLPDMPNRAVSIVRGPGTGLSHEGLFDMVTFQVSCRGGEQNLDDAETIAYDVDDILTGRSTSKSENFFITPEIYVSQLGRVGGGPSQLTITDSQSRFVFTCNYFAQFSTNIGM